MDDTPIFEHIRQQGQVRDADIAAALGLGIARVRNAIDGLAARGRIFCCRVTRFDNGKRIDEVLCRVSGYIPSIYKIHMSKIGRAHV